MHLTALGVELYAAGLIAVACHLARLVLLRRNRRAPPHARVDALTRTRDELADTAPTEIITVGQYGLQQLDTGAAFVWCPGCHACTYAPWSTDPADAWATTEHADGCPTIAAPQPYQPGGFVGGPTTIVDGAGRTVRTIPRATEIRCDGCGATVHRSTAEVAADGARKLQHAPRCTSSTCTVDIYDPDTGDLLGETGFTSRRDLGTTPEAVWEAWRPRARHHRYAHDFDD